MKKQLYSFDRDFDGDMKGYWSVNGPNIHEKFEDKFLAQKVAKWLNAAYELGYLTKFKDEHDKII